MERDERHALAPSTSTNVVDRATKDVVKYARVKKMKNEGNEGLENQIHERANGTTTTTTTTRTRGGMTSESLNDRTSETKNETETRTEAKIRGLEIIEHALGQNTATSRAPSAVTKRTFVFKSRNKLARSANAERQQRARLAKLAESSAFFDHLDCVSLAEESEESTPKRGAAMGEPLGMSPNGLIDALQGLGLVNDAPMLRAKITGAKAEVEVLRATALPREPMNAFDRVSNWVSTLKPFSPLAAASIAEERLDDNDFAIGSSVLSMSAHEAASDSESIADTDSIASLGNVVEKLDIVDDTLSPLDALLLACGQTQDDIKTMTMLCKSYFSNKAKKIGEGTYGEAFKGDDVVTKIIPMGGNALVNGEVQMGPSEVHAETAIISNLTRLSADSKRKNFTDGFIRLINASVCRGPYSKKLLTAWDEYAAHGSSENEKPDNLPNNQLYIAFTCEDGGIDLEHFEFQSATEAIALLFQIVVALAVAEEESQFEHRDLHWGNVLIKRTRMQKKIARLNGVDINIQTSGLNVAIIDFTLSRLTADSGKTFYLDLNADPELFNGPKKHCQSETYRRMKKATKGKWDAYEPKTNALWLHYLADTVLEQKHYSVTTEQKKSISDFRKRALTYKSAHAAMFDDLFNGIWTSGKSIDN